MAAAKYGHDECVSMLIAAGANVHAVTKVILSLQTHCETLTADNNLSSVCGHHFWCFSSRQDEWNAIIYANVNGHELCVKLLTAAGCEVNQLVLKLYFGFSKLFFDFTQLNRHPHDPNSFLRTGGNVNRRDEVFPSFLEEISLKLTSLSCFKSDGVDLCDEIGCLGRIFECCSVDYFWSWSQSSKPCLFWLK